MKKNAFLTFIFACIPGAGQMYQGYMKRGLSLITMFCLFIIVGSATGLDALVVGCIVVYMYSFFDTFNLRAQIIAENAPADDYLVHINWKDKRMQDFMMDSHKLLGWGLIALGGLVAYENIIMREADAPEAPEETADFAMPKLSALLGDPVTPEDPDEPEQPENAEGDDGRTE